ncbi:MAG: DUF2179 domain-containing protein [Firmicutes bacterium]|nr:DUF2179 domain-containing protein [Bacillota bacterium]
MLETCIGIFLARACDVSLGTLRTVYSVKGKPVIAAIIAFVEVFIWYMVAREALNTAVDSLWIPFSYAGGYATGTMLGTFISNKYVKGLACVQVITQKNNQMLIDAIRERGYGISVVALKNDYDAVKKEMLLIEVNKKSIKDLTELVKSHDASAFVMVNETKIVQNGLIK